MTELEQRYWTICRRERLTREAAYADATEIIGEFEVLPLNAKHIASLRAIESPFVLGGDPTVDDTATFLWKISPEYQARECPEKDALRAKCRRLWANNPECFLAYVGAIRSYIEDAFQDSPPNTIGQWRASYYAEAAAVCDTFGAEYGWENAVTLATPLKQLFQQLKIIDARHMAKRGVKAAMFNPSDFILGQILDEDNAALRTN